MFRILAADGLAKGAVEKLKEKGFEIVEQHYEPEVLGKELANFDVIVVRSATKVRKPIIDEAVKAGRLKLIIRAGVGVDNIDVEYAKQKGIKVMNTPKASSASVAELTIAHMFALARYVNISNVTMREAKWEKKKYKGIELSGKVLGLIGSGRIAKEVEKRARALGMDVIYTNRSGKKDNFCECEYCCLEDVLKKSDFVSLHIPYDKEKGAVISKKEIDMMKDGAFLINCARGGVVNEHDLLDALNSGKLAGAGIDVYEEEPTKNTDLVSHPNVSVTPHIGASTKEAQKRIGEEVYNIVVDFFNK
ncbi:D-2-hydroxyacid dehydrogenase [Haloimpatiens sp. FM7330]|uniref:D-2-hydroxyacid dehydrogenase n=1 Tax=Haloimpatiens sp. FM7330 TaxID=3298610 RepID=UPI00364266C5